MRTTILSRVVIAVATIGISAGVLAATPTHAAGGVARALVLDASIAIGAEAPNTRPDRYAPSTKQALRALTNPVCGVDTSSELVVTTNAAPTESADGAEGLTVIASIMALNGALPEDQMRICAFGAIATQNAAFSLNGTATLDYGRTVVSRLSGGTTVTGPIHIKLSPAPDAPAPPMVLTFATHGSASHTTTTARTVRVPDPKSKAAQKAAKATYTQALAAAKKKYKKALTKAGSSTTKKTAAKRAYAAKKKSLKASYTFVVANYAFVKQTQRSTSTAPFQLNAVIDLNAVDQ